MFAASPVADTVAVLDADQLTVLLAHVLAVVEPDERRFERRTGERVAVQQPVAHHLAVLVARCHAVGVCGDRAVRVAPRP